jgi:NAD(P)-dependent dehydrogenase (short-subunit alcohol dehydrogenase family)
MMPLQDKVVLVTGAARGIGAAVAREAARQGARVALVGLEPALLAEVHSGLPGGPHAWYEADVTSSEQLDAACAGAAEALGGIDIALAGAGVASLGTVAAGDFDGLLRTLDVNLVGVVRTVKAALPYVVRRRGYMMLIASAASFTALPGMAAYCASKAGVEHFANVLRLELAPSGVAVGSVHPSWIDTDLVRDARSDLTSFSATLRRLPWPMGTVTSVEDCAAAIVAGMRRRKRKVYVPRSVALVQALRTVVLSPVSDKIMSRRARVMIPRLEAETRRLGRAFGEHSVGAGRAASQLDGGAPDADGAGDAG